MGNQRSERLSGVIKEVVSDAIRRLKDVRLQGKMISVTDVEVSGDMRHAKVFVSIYGSEEQQEEAMAGLSSAAGVVRTEVAKEVKLRVSPEIHFRLDKSIERGAHITALLNRIKQESEGGHD